MSSSTEGILTVERMNTRTLKDQVAHLVSVAILSGKIKTGERLNESKLAQGEAPNTELEQHDPLEAAAGKCASRRTRATI